MPSWFVIIYWFQYLWPFLLFSFQFFSMNCSKSANILGTWIILVLLGFQFRWFESLCVIYRILIWFSFDNFQFHFRFEGFQIEKYEKNWNWKIIMHIICYLLFLIININWFLNYFFEKKNYFIFVIFVLTFPWDSSCFFFFSQNRN